MKSGFFLLDKPEDWSTFDLIRDLRRKSGLRKIGHTGTLDPFATGLVILCLGHMTRLSHLFLRKDKEYLVEMKLGEKTDTADLTGELIEKKSLPELNENLLSAAVDRIYQIEKQTPPRYSAVKISGKPAYKLAREKKEFNLQERDVKIHLFEILSVRKDTITYCTRVSKGTYIRTLTETFAEMLGTVAHTIALRRTAIGEIKISQAVSPEEIDEHNWQKSLKSVKEIVTDIPQIYLTAKQASSFLHGNKIDITSSKQTGEVLVFSSDDDRQTGSSECLGLGKVKESFLYPDKVFSTS